MAERRDPTTPGQTERSVDPSGPTHGTESSEAVHNPSAFPVERGNIESTPKARDTREMTFLCAEAGHLNCNWEIRGRSPEEMLPEIERHGRERHNIKADASRRKRILDAIHERSAA